MTIRVGRSTSAETRELRHAVLRPGRPLGVLDSPDDARGIDVAAWDDDSVIGSARIFSNPFHRFGFDEPDAWQLRSMAVDPAYQGSGIGRRILDAVVEIAREMGVPLLWAYGRTAALGFYEKAGWIAHGDEFIHEGSGLPHYVITLDLRRGVGGRP